MAEPAKKAAWLLLEDGTVFQGISMGKQGTTIGEVVFNTCTASYQSLLSDPTYYGQIVAQTYPLVGNRGVEDSFSRIMASGYIAREWCSAPSSAGFGVTLDQYLKERDIVGLCGIDTRALTRKLRDKGYFKGAITDSLEKKEELLEAIQGYSIQGAVKAVTIRKPENLPCAEEKYRVAVLDYGFNRAVLEPLRQRGCSFTLFPAATAAQEIQDFHPDGVFFSDGPGDPDEEESYIHTIQALMSGGIPSFGVGLGHQMMGLAMGCRICSMKKGHRGSNQPVLETETGRLMVTTQNHGYALQKDSIPAGAGAPFLVNVNDGSVEGMLYPDKKAFSVQFEPADGPGKQDTAWVFDRFIRFMEGGE